MKNYELHNNENSINIATKEYVDAKLSRIETVFNTHVKNIDSAHSIEEATNLSLDFDDESNDSENIIVDIPENKKDDVYANDVITDSNHRFITDSELEKLSAALVDVDLEAAISDASINFRNKLNVEFNKLLNCNDAMSKLSIIIELLNQEPFADNILNEIAKKVDTEEFENHIKSTSKMHLTPEDKQNLMALAKVVKYGYADWNAPESDINAIKNKPTSMPANGGNADTVGGYGVENICNKRSDSIIIGTEGYNYNALHIDAMVKEDKSNTQEIFDAALDSLCYLGGKIKVREGDYKLEQFVTKDRIKNYGQILLEGNGLSTIIYDSNMELMKTGLRDLSIADSTMIITEDVDISHVSFNECTILFKNSNNANITNCAFHNCKFETFGYLQNCIITLNRFIGNTFSYISANNIIQNNMTC